MNMPDVEQSGAQTASAEVSERIYPRPTQWARRAKAWDFKVYVLADGTPRVEWDWRELEPDVGAPWQCGVSEGHWHRTEADAFMCIVEAQRARRRA